VFRLADSEGKGSETVVGGCWIDVTETVRERISTPFYLLNDTFDAVTISMSFVSEIEAVSSTSFFQRRGDINKKHGVVNGVFLTEFTEEDLS